MSLNSGESLPLPAEPEYIQNAPQLHQAWETLVLLSEEVSQGKTTIKRNTGPIMLAVKYLQAKVPEAYRIERDEAVKAQLKHAANAIINAGKWLLPQVKADLSNHGALKWAVTVAKDELNQLTSTNQAVNDTYHIEHCRRVYELVGLFVRDKEQAQVSASTVKQALKALDTLVPSEGPSTPLGNRLFRPYLRSSRAGARPVDNLAAIKGYMKVSSEDQEHVRRYKQGVASLEGIVQSRVPLKTPAISTIPGTGWLDDNVIDAYLALVCHHGSGNFKALDAGASFPLTGTPRYYAWTTQFLEGLDIVQSWVPGAYLAPRLEDVQQHFFPVICGHSGVRNHWALFHMFKEGGSWRVEFYSSLPGYFDVSKVKFIDATRRLREFSNGALKVSQVRPHEARIQPRQTNSSDCGVLILLYARWIMERWPLETLKPDQCAQYRDRMIVELEKWRLD
ncbi:MAG: hypothetical protein Q9222_001932 [Ikaeria aurantiellina]